MDKKKTPPFRTLHFWAIHKRVARKEWDYLDDRTRAIIAGDYLHCSHEYRTFVNRVNTETQQRYEDPDYWQNEPFSFRYSKN